MTLGKPKKLFDNWRERKRRNDIALLVRFVERYSFGYGQSLVAVDAVRRRRRITDTGLAQEPRTHPLLALAGGFCEISDSFLTAGRHGKPSGMVARFRSDERWMVFCDGTGQPAFHANDFAWDLSGRPVDGFPEPG